MALSSSHRRMDAVALDRRLLGHQLAQLFEDFYVDLDRVRSTRGFDPVAALRSAVETSDLMAVFEQLGDRHSALRLPELCEAPAAPAQTAYPGPVAMARQQIDSFPSAYRRLGVRLEQATEGDSRRVWITGVDPELAEVIAVGTEVTHWNGVPIQRAAAELGERLRGANPAARAALGLKALPMRLLGHSRPPTEDWVWLTLQQQHGTTDVRLHWLDDAATVHTPAVDRSWQHQLNHTFSGDGFRCGLTAYSAAYVRLFNLPDWHDLRPLRRWLETSVKRHQARTLLLDLRSNPGGQVQTAERLARLLGVGRETPAKTPLVRYQSRPSSVLSNIERRFAHSNLDNLSQGRAASDPFERLLSDGLNRQHKAFLRPVHFCSIAVIVDALTYSAAEVLAALLEQLPGTKVVGPDPTTGGGGANAWCFDTLDRLQRTVGARPPHLPRGVDLLLPVRRIATRRGGHWVTLEHVEVDHHLPLSRRDLLFGNRDLVQHAQRVLGSDGNGPCTCARNHNPSTTSTAALHSKEST